MSEEKTIEKEKPPADYWITMINDKLDQLVVISRELERVKKELNYYRRGFRIIEAWASDTEILLSRLIADTEDLKRVIRRLKSDLTVLQADVAMIHG